MEDWDNLPRLRKILSKNVRALIEEAKKAPSQSRLATIKGVAQQSQAIGGGLTNGTVGRMATGESPVNIDAIDDLAVVFGLEPWHLLIENLNPKALPRLADAAFLSEIRQLVDTVSAPVYQTPTSPATVQPVEPLRRGRRVTVTPALDQAVKAVQGEKKNARRSTGNAPKQKGRGRG